MNYYDTPVGSPNGRDWNKGRADIYDALDDIFFSIGRIASSAITGIVAPVLHATADAAVATKDALTSDTSRSSSSAVGTAAGRVTRGASRVGRWANVFWTNKALPFLKKHIVARGDFEVKDNILIYFNSGHLGAIIDCYDVKYIAANAFANCELVDIQVYNKDNGDIILLPNAMTDSKVQRIRFSDHVIFNSESFEDSNTIVMIEGSNCYDKLNHCRENGIRAEFNIFLPNESLYNAPLEKQKQAIIEYMKAAGVDRFYNEHPQNFLVIKMDGSIGKKGILGIVSSYTYTSEKVADKETFKSIMKSYILSKQTEKPMDNPNSLNDIIKYNDNIGLDPEPSENAVENFHSLDNDTTSEIYINNVKTGVEELPPIPNYVPPSDWNVQNNKIVTPVQPVLYGHVYEKEFEAIYQKLNAHYGTPKGYTNFKQRLQFFIIQDIQPLLTQPYDKKKFFYLVGNRYISLYNAYNDIVAANKAKTESENAIASPESVAESSENAVTLPENVVASQEKIVEEAPVLQLESAIEEAPVLQPENVIEEPPVSKPIEEPEHPSLPNKDPAQEHHGTNIFIRTHNSDEKVV